MYWNIKQLLTNNDGSIQSETDLTLIFDDISVMETVGNELYNECGDIQIKTRSVISFQGSYHNWISVYINGLLFGIYEFDGNHYEFDDKKGIYTFRLKSIHKTFIENIQNLRAGPYSVNTDYNYAIVNSSAKVYYLVVYNGEGSVENYLSQYTFCLGDILNNLSGKHNSFGYLMDSIIQPCKKKETGIYDLPVLWRGLGIPDTVSSEGEAITMTFYELNKYIFNIQNFKFTVSDITIEPDVGSVYSNNSSNFEIIAKDLTSGSGSLYGVRTSGTNNPLLPGTLTKVSGIGDATIAYSTWAYQTDMNTQASPYGSMYSANSNNFQVIAIENGIVYTRRVSGSGTPSTLKYLTKVSGVGDNKIGFSVWNYEDLSYDTTWFDILKIIGIVYNSYIFIVPKITGGYLKIDLKIKPRIELIASGQITAGTWIDRIRDKNKFQIDGVSIDTSNYQYLYGDNFGNLFSKDIPVAENQKPNSNNDIDLYIGITDEGDHDPYDYSNPNDVFYKPGSAAFIQQYYEDLIGAGDGYSGTMLPNYNDGAEKLLKVLDIIQFASINVQLTTISINKDFLAKVEGIKI